MASKMKLRRIPVLSGILERFKGGKSQEENASYLIMSFSRSELLCLGVWPNEEPKMWAAQIDSGVIDENGEVMEMPFLVELIQKAIQKIGSPDYGIAVIPDEFSFYQAYDVTAPSTDQAIAEAIARGTEDHPFRVRTGDDNNYEKEPISTVHQVFDDPDPDQKNTTVALCMFPQRLIDTYQSLFEAVDIPLTKVDTVLFSILRTVYTARDYALLPDQDEEGEARRDETESVPALVLVSRDTTSVLPLIQGVPRYQRQVAIGFDEAESTTLKANRLVDEIEKSLGPYQDHGAARREDINTLWVIAPTGQWMRRLSAELSYLSIEHMTPELSEVYTSTHFGIDDSTGVYTALLAALDKDSSDYFGNAVYLKAASEKGNAMQHQLAKWMPHVAVLALGSMIWMTWGQAAEIKRLDTVLSDTSLQVQQLASVRAKTAQVRVLEEQARERHNALIEVYGNAYYYPDFFEFVMQTLPETVRLNTLLVKGRQWTSRAESPDWESIVHYLAVLRNSPMTNSVEISGVSYTNDLYTFNLTVELTHRGEEHVKKPAR